MTLMYTFRELPGLDQEQIEKLIQYHVDNFDEAEINKRRELYAIQATTAFEKNNTEALLELFVAFEINEIAHARKNNKELPTILLSLEDTKSLSEKRKKEIVKVFASNYSEKGLITYRRIANELSCVSKDYDEIDRFETIWKLTVNAISYQAFGTIMY